MSHADGIAAWAEGRRRAELAAAPIPDKITLPPDVEYVEYPVVPPALLDALDHFDRTDPLMAALGVLDAKLGVLIADQERLVRLLTAVAGVVDCRIEVGP